MNLWLIAQIVLLVLAIPFVLAALYLLMLTFAACLHPDKQRICGVFRGPRMPQSHFIILIPAHNEELLLGDVLHRLRDQSYPATHYEVVVIADNCADMTAEVARKGGATALVRHDLANRGKGQALNWAMQGPLKDWPQPWDALVIMDADSVLNADFLWFMDERLRQGHQALQGYYGVQNPGDSWRTALMTVALAAFHFLRPLGRDKLGLPCGLKGNGMCFSRQIVERFGYPASSVVEDIELALMYLRNGIGVKFAAGAQVFGQMAATTQQADSQRKRWEGGRLPLLKNWALPLWREGLRERNLAKLDGAVDLFVPPLAMLVMLIVVGGLATGLLLWLHTSSTGQLALALWGGAGLGVVTYVFAGLILIHAPRQDWLRLVFVPVFIFWKFIIYFRMTLQPKRKAPAEWVRTDRKEMK